MAKKKKRRKAGRRKRQQPTSPLAGWIYMLVGLALGLAVAFAIYVNDRKQGGPVTLPVALIPGEPASSVPEAVQEPPEADITFDFYDMLPSLDVEIFEDERAAAAPATPARVAKPGIYILQAGSFTTLEDASRRKAEIGFLGVRSEIKKGNVEERTVYRVYTEPMEQPAEVNRVTSQLTDAGIEVLLKRVSD